MKKYRGITLLLVVIFAAIGSIYLLNSQSEARPVEPPVFEHISATPLPASVTPVYPGISSTPMSAKVLPPRTKMAGCVSQGPLQDKQCSPGLADPNLTKEVICADSFTTKTIRNVPESRKKAVYAEYGILTHTTGQYEVDHIISLELGGSNDIANLYPEAAEPRPGFHEKDKIENFLHRQVCKGAITLEEAQWEIATNWLMIQMP